MKLQVEAPSPKPGLAVSEPPWALLVELAKLTVTIDCHGIANEMRRDNSYHLQLQT
jgi:hypothetical protein